MTFQDATEMARQVREEETNPATLVESAIERIESLNPDLNAVITRTFDRARQRADSSLKGPFAGVPFLLKDLIAADEGVRMTFGSRMMEDFVADHDSYLVERYRDAGLIVLGKTNAPEFGLTPTTEPELLGPCRNPWDTDRTVGGSSGGSAAAVASGMVPMAHGNDGGGSLRIPAACCGVFGFKPTRARIILGPDYGDMMGGLVIEHAITRSVRDSAALLDATRGPAKGDPYRAPEPDEPYREAIQTPPDDLNVGLILDSPTGADIHSDCRQATEDAATLCEDLGHTVEELSLDIQPDLLEEAFMTVWAAGAASAVEASAFEAGKSVDPDQLEPLTFALYEMGTEFSSSDYLMSMGYLQQVSRSLQEDQFDRYDVLLSPMLAKPPVEIGWLKSSPDNPLEGFERSAEFAPFSPIYNITGQPAMSTPLYWNDENVPIGTQFAAGFGREECLFKLAAQLEEARPWSEKLPPINALD